MIVSIFYLVNLPSSYQFQPLIIRTSILLLSAGILYAEDPISEATKNPMSLLPDGSVLHDVLLPRYDKERVLVSDLKADIMTLINPQNIEGENVLIKFYKPDRSLRGKVKLQKALFNQSTSNLRANEPVEITTDNLIAKGDGLIYSFQNGQGFLIGPSSTWISHSEPTTSMRPNTSKTAALLALCFAPSLTIAAPPTNVSEAELAEIHTAATSVKPKLDTQIVDTETTLNADLTSAKKASDAAHSFVKSGDLKEILAETTATNDAPLEIAPGPNDTIIKCDGGMYFDAEAGVLVYLKNVTVNDPRFTLNGADELKVFFEKKAPKKTVKGDKKEGGATEPTDSAAKLIKGNKKEEGKTESIDPTTKQVTGDNKKESKTENVGPAANFGDVHKLIATGTVRFIQKGVAGKEPVEASGGVLTYDVPKGEIIISQRYPWVKQGKFYARAKQPNLTLRLLNDGSFSTQGEWEMGGSLKLNGR